MSSFFRQIPIEDVIVEATITRADGTVESLGEICRMKKPGFFTRIKRWLFSK
jgi:hypothetical protein